MTTPQLFAKEYKNEDQMTAYFFEWVMYNYPALRKVYFHVPNGGARDAREGMKFKSMGAVPGIPDHVCMLPMFGLELKMQNGTQSSEQKLIQKVWGERGIPYHLAKSMHAAVDVLVQYAGNPLF